MRALPATATPALAAVRGSFNAVRIATIAATVLFSLSKTAWAADPASGNALLESCRSLLDSSYNVARDLQQNRENVSGILAALNLHETRGLCLGTVGSVRDFMDVERKAPPGPVKLACIPKEVTNGQLVRVVVGFMEGHSELLHWRLSDLTIAALAEAWPCPKNSSGHVSQDTTPQQTESRAARRAEASIVLANVLSAASVHGFQVDSGDAFFPDSEADAIWSASDIGGSGNVGGSLSIIEGAKIDNPQIKAVFTGSDAKLCKGKFVSGPLPSERNDETRMFTSCQETDKTTLTQTFHYIAVTRPKGGFICFEQWE